MSKKTVHFLSGLVISFMSAFILLSSAPSTAEPAEEKKARRPRIGLVLGGGGARGAAHLGVLEVLEELKVPVDVIVGTSVGAIVGGLYASGRTTAEIKALLGMDWDKAFTDVPPRQERSFRRKQDDNAYRLDFDLGFKNGDFVMPKGLIQGQTQIMVLKEQTFHTYKIENFDDLPIPFRAVATNIENGEKVVMSSGELATAIRASMTVPGIFAPVEIDGKMLVDGGMTDNVPVDVARQLGAEKFIVVDVGSPYRPAEKLNTVFDITGQLTTLLVRKNADETIRNFNEKNQENIEISEKEGVLIQPQLGNFSSGDFKNALKAVVIGKDAAEKHESFLKTLSVSDQEYDEFLKNQRRMSTELPVIDFIRVKNRTGLSTDVIKSRLNISEGDRLNIPELQEDIASIYGLGFFERIEYSLVYEDGETGLIIEAVEKSWGPNYIKFGINLMDNFKGDAFYNVGVNFTRMPINSLGAEWRNDLWLGKNALLASEFYQPLEKTQKYFFAPGFELSLDNLDYFDSAGNNVARVRTQDVSVNMDLGRQLGTWGELRIGVSRQWGDLEVEIGYPGFDSVEFDRGGWHALLSYDTMDAIAFSRTGSKANLNFEADYESLGADENVEVLEMNWYGVRTWGKTTFGMGLHAESLLDNEDASLLYSSFLGGLTRLSGYAPDEIYGNHTCLAFLSCYRQIWKPSHKLYLGGTLETGNAWDDRHDISLDSAIMAGSVFIGKETAVGPLMFAVGFAEGGRSSFYLQLGSLFL